MNVLVAVDLAHEPERVVEVAGAWAARFGATADLAYVDTHMATLASRLADRAGGFAAELHAMGEIPQQQLEQLRMKLPPESRGTSTVLVGAADKEIADRAATYDLVIMGTHGRTGMSYAVLGSVAERIARLSNTPALIVRNAPGPGAPRALVGVALGEEALPLVQRATAFVAQARGQLDVAYVEDIVEIAAFTMEVSLQAAMSEHLAAQRATAQAHLDSLLGTIPPFHRGRTRTGVGIPATQLATWGAEYDLIAVGTHHRTGFDRLWLGSVAERVVRTCPKSVLVLPIAVSS